MNNEEESLESILSQVALGDRAAFSRLYNRTAAKLFGVCLRILTHKSEAEEALQETYVKIWRSAGQYAGTQARPVSWLAAIARNQAIDALRRRRHPQSLGLDTAMNLTDDTPSPEAMATYAEERRQLDGCLNELEDKDAVIIRAAYMEGLTYEALAQHMAIPLGTIKSRIRRSLARLKDCLDDLSQPECEN